MKQAQQLASALNPARRWTRIKSTEKTTTDGSSIPVPVPAWIGDGPAPGVATGQYKHGAVLVTIRDSSGPISAGGSSGGGGAFTVDRGCGRRAPGEADSACASDCGSHCGRSRLMKRRTAPAAGTGSVVFGRCKMAGVSGQSPGEGGGGGRQSDHAQTHWGPPSLQRLG